MTTKYENLLRDIERPKFRRLPISLLDVDPEVQRDPPSKQSIRQLVDNFQPVALGVFHVSLRRNGFHHLIDGQRRKAAMVVRGEESERVPCQVYEGLTKPQEAAMFKWLNTQRIVGSFDAFDKSRIAGDPMCVNIARICSAHGFTIAKGTRGEGRVSCVSRLVDAYRMDGVGGILNSTFYVIVTAFGHQEHAASASIVGGLSNFLNTTKDVDLDKLAEKLAAAWSPAHITNAARNRRESERGSLTENMVAVIARTYSSRRRRA